MRTGSRRQVDGNGWTKQKESETVHKTDIKVKKKKKDTGRSTAIGESDLLVKPLKPLRSDLVRSTIHCCSMTNDR